MLIFGTAGIPLSTPPSGDTIAGLRQVSQLGLGAMEIEFVRSIYLRDNTAPPVACVGGKLGLRLSCHAPYYLNLNASDEEKLRKSAVMIRQSARIASLAGARTLVFHPGYYLKEAPETVYSRIKYQLEMIVDKLNDEGTSIELRPELAGKTSQFGTLSEILRLSKEIPGVAPAIDFAHLYAATGRYNSYPEFAQVLEKIGEVLGPDALKTLHLHVSGIESGKGGERRHRNLLETSYRYEELIQALIDFQASGLVICESPNIEDDALLLQSTWRELSPGPLKA
jgi:deoxyribonuclease-4